jgi:hypothetical protein
MVLDFSRNCDKYLESNVLNEANKFVHLSQEHFQLPVIGKFIDFSSCLHCLGSGWNEN